MRWSNEILDAIIRLLEKSDADQDRKYGTIKDIIELHLLFEEIHIGIQEFVQCL